MSVQVSPHVVTKVMWYDYISRGESGLAYTFLVQGPPNVFADEMGSRIVLYLTEKENGKTYDITPMWCDKHGVPTTVGMYSFTIPALVEPGIYHAQLKAITSYGDKTCIAIIPTTKDDLQITVLDTQYINPSTPIPGGNE